MKTESSDYCYITQDVEKLFKMAILFLISVYSAFLIKKS